MTVDGRCEERADCLDCIVPNECNQSSPLCWLKMGVKSGQYKESVFTRPSPAVPRAVSVQMQFGVGHKVEPLWRLKDGMGEFTEKVLSYQEEWMRLEKWKI